MKYQGEACLLKSITDTITLFILKRGRTRGTEWARDLVPWESLGISREEWVHPPRPQLFLVPSGSPIVGMSEPLKEPAQRVEVAVAFASACEKATMMDQTRWET